MKFLWALILLAAAFSPLIAVEISLDQYEQRIFDLSNQKRIEKGLQPLVYEAGLARVAKIHSRNMGWDGKFDHIDSLGRRVSDRQAEFSPELMMIAIGENLSRSERSDYKFDPAETVDGWMNSVSHSKNLLKPEYTHMGVGMFLMGYKLYTTQVLGIPILKVTTLLPPSFTLDSAYVVEFEYLSPKSSADFQCSLATPDPKQRIMFTESMYYEGSIPLKINWVDAKHFRLALDFKYGSGKYSLQFGWDGSFYKDMLIFTVN